jgi:hypothetical protein
LTSDQAGGISGDGERRELNGERQVEGVREGSERVQSRFRAGSETVQGSEQVQSRFRNGSKFRETVQCQRVNCSEIVRM